MVTSGHRLVGERSGGPSGNQGRREAWGGAAACPPGKRDVARDATRYWVNVIGDHGRLAERNSARFGTISDYVCLRQGRRQRCRRPRVRRGQFDRSQGGRRYLRCGRRSAACPSSPGSCSRSRPGTWTPCRSSPRHSPHPRSRWKSETAPECSAAVRSDEHGRPCSGFIANTASRSSIETIKSLDGAWIADVAQRRGRMAGADQLYILVAGSERDVGVIAARHGPASRLTDQQRESIRRAFLGPLQAGEADGALEQGVRAIGATLDSAATSRPKLSGRDALISVTILVAALAVLLASQTRAWYGVRNRRRRRTAAGAAEPGHVVGSPSASSHDVASPSGRTRRAR